MEPDEITGLDPYDVDEKTGDRLANDYTYHPPTPEQVGRYNVIRQEAYAFANFLCRNCPPSRELSLALTHIEEAVFYANAAIARNEK